MTSEAISTSISLESMSRHAGIIRSMRPLTVETSPRQWDYAISVRLVLGEHAPQLRRLPVKVSARVTVESGQLGCILVGDDWTTLAGKMAPMVGEGRHTVDLTWERGGIGANLVFRNHGADNRPCVFTVEAVQLGPVPADPFGYSPLIEDVVEPGGRRLDLSRVKLALEQPGRFGRDDRTIFDHLRRKWSVVPAGLEGRRGTADLLQMPADDLRDLWSSIHREATTAEGFAVRGWYQALYRDVLRGKKVLDIGSGMGIDGIELARHGARMTFVDIVEDNLAVIQRLCGIFGIRDGRFVYLEQLSSLDALDDDYDVVWCQGSQIKAPFEFARRECAVILQHLKPEGRWIELAYPRERWLRDGRPPFQVWGTMTDGEGTPWVEWYDLDKLLRRLVSARFEPVLALNFHGDDFNWFDLQRTV